MLSATILAGLTKLVWGTSIACTGVSGVILGIAHRIKKEKE